MSVPKKLLPFVIVGLLVATLSACGGGGGRIGDTPSMNGGPDTGNGTTMDEDLPFLAGHGLTAGNFTVAPGTSEQHGNVVVFCPAGGAACALTVAADGTASYDKTRGMPSFIPALQPQELPVGHGLTAGNFTIAPGTSEQHGNVVVFCPAGGAACALTVAADGTASYDKTGGMPSFIPALQPQELPAGHGLTAGNFTIAPGASEEHGDVVVSCPAGGEPCVLTVAADGTASYDKTGGMPSFIPALQPQELPAGHGLTAGNFTIAPGTSEQHGNVVVSCPAGGAACALTVAADGTASYDKTRGMPSFIPALQPQELPAGHGLTAGNFTIAPGASEEHGDVVVSCPAGGEPCVLTVAADGTASYDKTGGMPSFIPALQPQELPVGHGLTAGNFTIAPGTSEQHGDVVVSCPAGGEPCVLTVAADGTAFYDKTGGMPSLILVSSEKLAGETILPPDVTNYPYLASYDWIWRHIRRTAPRSRPRHWILYHPDYAPYRPGNEPVPGTTWTLVGLVQGPGVPSSSGLPPPPSITIVRVYNPDQDPRVDYDFAKVAENYVGITRYGEFWLFGPPDGNFVPADHYSYENENLRPQWDEVFPADKTVGSWRGVLIAANRTTVADRGELRGISDGPVDLIVGSVDVRLRSMPEVPGGFAVDVAFFRIHHFDDPNKKYEDVSWSLEGSNLFGNPPRSLHSGRFVANYHLPVRQDKFINGRFVGPNGEDVLGQFATKLYYRDSSIPEDGRFIAGEHFIWGYGSFGAQHSPLPRYLPTDSLAPSGTVGGTVNSLAAPEAPAKVFEDLGPWDDTPVHIQDRVDLGDWDVTFGVRLGNGSSEPWVSGPVPSTELENNQDLSRSASWSGHLLGLTSATEIVRGNAALTIQLETLDGELGFTMLESWPSGEMSEAVGTGTPWGDGDLHYLVSVQGNTFVGAGGDAGMVTGSFFGDSHEAMGGVVEHHDLTAVFGGKR